MSSKQKFRASEDEIFQSKKESLLKAVSAMTDEIHLQLKKSRNIINANEKSVKQITDKHSFLIGNLQKQVSEAIDPIVRDSSAFASLQECLASTNENVIKLQQSMNLLLGNNCLSSSLEIETIDPGTPATQISQAPRLDNIVKAKEKKNEAKMKDLFGTTPQKKIPYNKYKESSKASVSRTNTKQKEKIDDQISASFGCEFNSAQSRPIKRKLEEKMKLAVEEAKKRKAETSTKSSTKGNKPASKIK